MSAPAEPGGCHDPQGEHLRDIDHQQHALSPAAIGQGTQRLQVAQKIGRLHHQRTDILSQSSLQLPQIEAPVSPMAHGLDRQVPDGG